MSEEKIRLYYKNAAIERYRLMEENYNLRQSIEGAKQNYRRFTERQIIEKKELLTKLTTAKEALEAARELINAHHNINEGSTLDWGEQCKVCQGEIRKRYEEALAKTKEEI